MFNGTGSRLGPEAQIDVSFGEQGKWGVDLGYNAITYTGNVINSLWTVTGQNGAYNNGLVPFGGATNNPLKKGSVTGFTTTTLAPYEAQYQTGTRRDTLSASGQYQMDEWTFKADIQHEHKQGSLEKSLYGTPGGMPFTLPVDFNTDRFDVSASYIDPDYQAVIQYTYSRFVDNNTGVTLPFPVSQASLSATSGPYAQSAFYSTPPSTSAHYVTVMVSDKLAPATRVTFNAHVGAELQNDTFTPNSADPNLSPTLGSSYGWFSHLNSLNQGTSATSPDAVTWVLRPISPSIPNWRRASKAARAIRSTVATSTSTNIKYGTAATPPMPRRPRRSMSVRKAGSSRPPRSTSATRSIRPAPPR